MRRSRAGEKPGPDTATPKLIGMLMNNKLVSLARGVSMALGTIRKCGRDSAAGILSLILLFTMPLISVIFAIAQPHFYRMWLVRVHWFERRLARALFVIFFPGRFLVLRSCWTKKKMSLSVSSDRRNLRHRAATAVCKLETRRSPSGRLILWVTDNDKAVGRTRQIFDCNVML